MPRVLSESSCFEQKSYHRHTSPNSWNLEDRTISIQAQNASVFLLGSSFRLVHTSFSCTREITPSDQKQDKREQLSKELCCFPGTMPSSSFFSEFYSTRPNNFQISCLHCALDCPQKVDSSTGVAISIEIAK